VKATSHRSTAGKKRRTTITLAVDSLSQAERIARSRKVSVNTVISEALSEGLRVHTALDRSDEVLDSYRKAFSSFSDDEMALLDGVVMQPAGKSRR
jgi:hypothetical protein